VWFWEVRFGRLRQEHFNVSNTAGDSGKTAVVNQAGMEQLQIVYFDETKAPLGARSISLLALEFGLDLV
jgi:hypothetical protein